MKLKQFAAASLASLALMCSAGAAGAYSITVSTADQNGGGFDALPGSPGFDTGNLTSASFDYSGPLNFFVNYPQTFTNAGDLNSAFFTAAFMSNYTCTFNCAGSAGGQSNANFSTQANFLASSGSAGTFQYGSFITIGLGDLAAGTVLTITHDDGISVFQGETSRSVSTSLSLTRSAER